MFPTNNEDYLKSYYKFEISFFFGYSVLVRNEDYLVSLSYFLVFFLFFGWLTETMVFIFCKLKSKPKLRFV